LLIVTSGKSSPSRFNPRHIEVHGRSNISRCVKVLHILHSLTYFAGFQMPMESSLPTFEMSFGSDNGSLLRQVLLDPPISSHVKKAGRENPDPHLQLQKMGPKWGLATYRTQASSQALITSSSNMPKSLAIDSKTSKQKKEIQASKNFSRRSVHQSPVLR
jgi:hypothetical protein